MALEPSSPRSRRALLVASLGGFAALMAQTLGRPATVRALDPSDVVLDALNGAAGSTIIRNTANDSPVFQGQSTAGIGVTGRSQRGNGVYGYSDSADGVHGYSGAGTGASGYSATGTGLTGTSESGTGVSGTGIVGISGISDSDTGVQGTSPRGVGVSGTSDSHQGVLGTSSQGAGVEGRGATSGVYGICPNGIGAGVLGTSKLGIGVDGRSNSPDQPASLGWTSGATGVLGYYSRDFYGSRPAARAHTGVMGVATTDGTGGYFSAPATTGVALEVSGKTKFSQSGRTSVAAGKSSQVIAMVGVTTASYIIATVQTNVAGVFVRAVSPKAGGFTIYLSKAVTARTDVGYLVLN